ncbi:MAG: sigma-70 family RNA polymerase sigma factor [Acidobacteriia bacterium]|nr:sigma-70 family RNA polymerase sigma factor [Terriglobia bacterium]
MATAILELNSEHDAGADADDQRLIESLRAGHERAYEELLARFQQPVYTLCLRLLNDEGEASDVVQEVFLKVFRNIGNFRGQSTLKTWIYRISVNEAHNARRWFFRHRRREVELDTDPYDARTWQETIPDSSRTPFEVTSDHEQAGMIQAALDRINPVFRSAVVLRDITDLSYEEIAEILGVSLGTVKSRILRGREALREELKGDLIRRRPLRLVPNTAE